MSNELNDVINEQLDAIWKKLPLKTKRKLLKKYKVLVMFKMTPEDLIWHDRLNATERWEIMQENFIIKISREKGGKNVS